MERKRERPGADAGPSDLLSCGGTGSDDSARGGKVQRRKPTAEAIVYEPDGVRVVPVKGRVRWMLERLLEAGERGFTAADGPAGARISHYVMRLRREGIAVEMVREPHKGAFPGQHGRYYCRSTVMLRDPAEAGGRAA